MRLCCMSDLVNIPGCFPSDSGLYHDRPAYSRTGSEILDQQFQSQFSNKQVIVRKTKSQHEFLTQIDALVKILIGYQFIKFTYSSCVTPLLLRAAFISVLNPAQVSINNYNSILNIHSPDQRRMKKLLASNFCLSLYICTILISAYYISLIFTWLIPLADEGKLNQLQNGSWWFILFIGESTPDYLPDMNIYLKLYTLNFHSLIIIELIIVFFQLILFQSLFKQLTIGDRKLQENELELVRTPKDLLSIPTNTNADTLQVPIVLRVNLLEALSYKAFESLD